MIDLKIQHYFSSGVYIREMHLPKDHFAETHKHNFDHLSILSKGKALVECDEEMQIYKAPSCIEIKAGKEHKITALEDLTWFCIHATDVTDADEIDHQLIKEN